MVFGSCILQKNLHYFIYDKQTNVGCIRAKIQELKLIKGKQP